jgi:hypothetical protein
MLAQLRDDSANIDGAKVLATVQEYKGSIESWGSACIANFAMYSMLIEAERYVKFCFRTNLWLMPFEL